MGCRHIMSELGNLAMYENKDLKKTLQVTYEGKKNPIEIS